jgi:hypothetical protein
VVVTTAAARVAGARSEAQETTVFRPTLAVPEMLEPFVKHLEPGTTRSWPSAEPHVHDLAFSRQGRVQRLWHGYEKHIPVIKIAVKGQKRAAPELVSAGPSPRSALEAERSPRIASCRSCTACIHLLPESLSDSPIPLQLSVARPLSSSSGKKRSAGVRLPHVWAEEGL